MNTLTRLLVALAATLAITAAAPPADAVTRGGIQCVTDQQWNGAKFKARPAIEQQWGVVGAGWRDPLVGGWSYARCGFLETASYFNLQWDWDRGLMYRTVIFPNGRTAADR